LKPPYPSSPKQQRSRKKTLISPVTEITKVPHNNYSSTRMRCIAQHVRCFIMTSNLMFADSVHSTTTPPITHKNPRMRLSKTHQALHPL
jgi:hypothetical protein